MPPTEGGLVVIGGGSGGILAFARLDMVESEGIKLVGTLTVKTDDGRKRVLQSGLTKLCLIER